MELTSRRLPYVNPTMQFFHLFIYLTCKNIPYSNYLVNLHPKSLNNLETLLQVIQGH